MQEMILQIIQELALRKPVDIKLTTRSAKIAALYEPVYSDRGKLKSHKITVFLSEDNNRSLRVLIAHELIHAWQEEYKKTDTHGESFRETAEYIEDVFGLGGIYDPECDE